MNYEVTATRRRPQKFEDLVGQDFVVATLKNAIQSGKIAHAYLFSGPRGCGKTSSARILAKSLNCEHGPTATPCEECTCCKEITRGASLDVIEIDGASNTSVNDVRQIKDEILFPPNSSRYKIYIIDEVHMLSGSAFNALLKTIEEPPEYVIFIFATTELHKVPATIKSRCQQFHFRLGSVEQIKELLAKAADELGVKYEDEALYWIAKEATGSFRDAYTLFDQIVAFSDGFITYEKIRDKLGIVGIEALNEFSEFCVDGNSKSAIEKLDEFITSGISIEQFISDYSEYLRSLLLIEGGIQKESLLGQNPERYSKKVLSSWNKLMLERALSLFLSLYRDVRYSLSARYETELAVSRLCWLNQYVSNIEMRKAIEGARSLLMNSTNTLESSQVQKNDNGTAHTDFKMPPLPKSFQDVETPFQNSGNQEKNSASIVATEKDENDEQNFDESNGNILQEDFIRNNPSLSLEELKTELLKELGSKNKMLETLIGESENWIYQDGKIIVEVKSSYQMEQIKNKAMSAAALASEIWGKPVEFVGSVVQSVQENLSEGYPAVIDALKDGFRGEVISVTDATLPATKINKDNTSETDKNTDTDTDTDDDTSFDDNNLEDGENEE